MMMMMMTTIVSTVSFLHARRYICWRGICYGPVFVCLSVTSAVVSKRQTDQARFFAQWLLSACPTFWNFGLV